jgi:hypothetical protein
VILVIKARPLFLFTHLPFQKIAELPPKERVPGHEGYTSPEEL